MAMKGEIKRVAKRLTPPPIWSFARRLRAGQNRQVIEYHELPAHLLRNHRVLSRDKVLALENSIRTHYHAGWRAEDEYPASAYQKDLEDHLHNRIRDDRQRIIPWLDHVQALKGARILEIGGGTGSSTVALREQGAVVTAIDVDEDALVVANDRCRAYGVEATLKTMSGAELSSNFSVGTFDFIIFFACLEHMTVAERFESLRQAWDLLSTGGMMAIIETPNRLWFRDDHTAMLPFFHWLPNELAFAYSRFSKRDNFRELYRDYTSSSKFHFLRRGRGMSFHEIDLAIAPVSKLQIVSSLSQFGKNARHVTQDGSHYKSSLCQLFPHIHHGFFDEYLDLIFRKN
jgi:2-polyprenyl-3-methyl-5-hydroxy-6-metoxy-1,4-benzoquinol methylase